MQSTLKLTSSTILGKDQQKKLTLILNYLIDNPEAAQFLNPVEWQDMGLNDYPVIVKHPMNLLKVQQKLKLREYRTVQQVLDHIQLTWDNCKQYNQEGPFYTLADKMQRSYKKMIKNYLPNIQVIIPSKSQPGQQFTSQTNNSSNGVSNRVTGRSQQSRNINNSSNVQQAISEQEPEQIPQSQKNRFNQRLKQITQQELAQIVLVLQESSPDAFRQIGGGRCQIIIDNIESAIFKKINEKIDDFLEGEKPPNKKIKNL